jgi:hypothetical protein
LLIFARDAVLGEEALRAARRDDLEAEFGEHA